MIRTADINRVLVYKDLAPGMKLESIALGCIYQLGVPAGNGRASKDWPVYREGRFCFYQAAREIVSNYQHPPAGRYRVHELKTWACFFDQVLRGDKTLEIRIDDRQYKVGDTLHLRRYDVAGDQYTGEELYVDVTHVLRDFAGLTAGWVAMSITKPLPF